jgi:hypothetical protein
MSDDFVTVRECEIKDENMRRSLEHLRVSVEDYIVHSREMEAKLFDGQDKINILLAGEMEKAKSTQQQLTAHKDDQWKMAGVILTISGVIATIIVEIVKK